MAEESANLAALEAHGRAFLESFGLSSVSGVKRTAEELSGSTSAKKRRKNKANKASSAPSVFAMQEYNISYARTY